MRKKRFPLPKPGTVKFTYCKIPIAGAPRTGMVERRFYDCGYCTGCNKRYRGVETASVAGFPFLCENCYQMVYQYSLHKEDPYGIKGLWEDDEVSAETTRKVIACAKRLDFINDTIQNAMIYKMLINNEDGDEPEAEDYQRQPERRQLSEEGRKKLESLWAAYTGMMEVDRKSLKEAEAQGDGNSAGKLRARIKDSEEKLQEINAMLGNSQESRNGSFTNACGWTEKKELMHYKNVLPEADERDFEFDICDSGAFSDYLKKITITITGAYLNDRIRAIKTYINNDPLVDLTCEAVKTKDGLTQIRLVHRAETIDAAHEKFQRIILKYRKVFPYLSDASGMVYDDQKIVIVVLRQYRVEG